MIKLGNTARTLRESRGLTQRDAAALLGVSVVHFCNVENNKSAPSRALIDRYREVWGVDVYVLAWCLHGDTSQLPPAVRKSATALTRAWRNELNMEAAATCLTSKR